jgi:hypothetical protein
MIAFSTFTPPKKFSKQKTLKSDLRSYAPSVKDMTDLPDEGEGDNNGEEPSTKKRRITTCESDAPTSNKTKGGKKDAAGGRALIKPCYNDFLVLKCLIKCLFITPYKGFIRGT